MKPLQTSTTTTALTAATPMKSPKSKKPTSPRCASKARTSSNTPSSRPSSKPCYKGLELTWAPELHWRKPSKLKWHFDSNGCLVHSATTSTPARPSSCKPFFIPTFNFKKLSKDPPAIRRLTTRLSPDSVFVSQLYDLLYEGYLSSGHWGSFSALSSMLNSMAMKGCVVRTILRGQKLIVSLAPLTPSVPAPTSKTSPKVARRKK